MNKLVKGIPNMSEPQNEEPVYVVNQKRDGGMAMVHTPECRTIKHQVNENIREAYPRGIMSQSEPMARIARSTRRHSFSIFRNMRRCT